MPIGVCRTGDPTWHGPISVHRTERANRQEMYGLAHNKISKNVIKCMIKTVYKGCWESTFTCFHQSTGKNLLRSKAYLCRLVALCRGENIVIWSD